MPSEITMPQLSDTMTEGTLVKWHKKEGDKIQGNDELADVETDKATMPMEAFEEGVLAVVLAREGDKVKVGDVVGVIALAGEKPQEVKAAYTGKQKNAPKPGAEKAAEKPEKSEAATKPVPVSAPGASSAKDTVKAAAPSPAPAAAEPKKPGRIVVSPLAKRIAAEKGVDLSQVQGSGPGGRVVRRDVEQASTQPSAPGQPAAPVVSLPQRVGSGQVEQIELSRIRQTIATRLQQSKQQLPHFYETIDLDVQAMSQLREKLNKQLENEQVRLSISDLVNKAIASALKEHPALNAHFDAPNNRIVRYGDVHLGIAVALPDGLIVPVLRNIDQMGLREIRQRTVDLAERARAQRLKRDELTGATFSVSTLGAYGIREFSAIINPPEVGILAIGAAEQRAVVRDHQVVPRSMMTVTLSVDHRAVDGATAAEFLRTLKAMVHEPGMMLL